MNRKESAHLFIRSNRIFVGLQGASGAPDRSWDRVRGTPGAFERSLNTAEAIDFLESRTVPDDISGLRIDIPPEIQSLHVYPVQRSAAVFAHLNGGEIEFSPQLVDPLNPEAPCVLLKAEDVIQGGHLIRDGVLYSFDGESCRELFSTLKAAESKANDYRITYRLLSKIRDDLSKIEISLVEQFRKEDVLHALERDFRKAKLVAPKDLGIKLYGYQLEALRWMQFCHAHQLGCLVGDEMGLGKTATAISLISTNGTGSGPNLVVCPVTLLENWTREIARINPAISVRRHYGSDRIVSRSVLQQQNVVLTSYGMLKRDIHLFQSVDWNIIVLDEAQRIKNPGSSVSITCRRLRARCPVAMTGTPFENRPLDLWSIMDFIQPGYLGSREEFEVRFSGEISGGSHSAANTLKEIVGLFMMRRLKLDVQSDLPPKIEREHPLMMTRSEGEGYIARVAEIRRRNASGGGAIGAGFMELRQYCCHPAVLEGTLPDDPSSGSAKYQAMVELIEKAIEAGEKTLIFAPFVRMLNIFEKDLPRRFQIPVFRIDGQVDIKQRQETVDQFSAVNGPALLILNPQAGGVGLNITAANHVIHYCREWNPAVEDQASDRAHRIGQTRTVMVHSLFYTQTIDELVATKLAGKRALSRALVKKTTDKEMDRRTITEILKLEPNRFLPEADDADADEDPVLK